MDDSNNRRNFSRVAFDTTATLCQSDEKWSARVLDLSLKGVLIEDDPSHDFDTQQEGTITIQLTEDIGISMAVIWTHSENSQTGFKCTHIDLDSITHLRRLVELNVGDADLLERELSQLG